MKKGAVITWIIILSLAISWLSSCAKVEQPVFGTNAPALSGASAQGEAATSSLNGVAWQSQEVNKSLFSNPILNFTVNGGKITSLTISAFPTKEEWFLWTNNDPIVIQGSKFTYKLASENGNGKNLLLEGTFSSATSCNGTMTFPKGFFWVGFTMPNDLTIPWTAHPK